MDDRLCLLVIIGVTEQGRKELVAVEDGRRESEASWFVSPLIPTPIPSPASVCSRTERTESDCETARIVAATYWYKTGL
ncbi:hypothetical protein GCM10027428_20950 [Haliea atlantica]